MTGLGETMLVSGELKNSQTTHTMGLVQRRNHLDLSLYCFMPNLQRVEKISAQMLLKSWHHVVHVHRKLAVTC